MKKQTVNKKKSVKEEYTIYLLQRTSVKYFHQKRLQPNPPIYTTVQNINHKWNNIKKYIITSDRKNGFRIRTEKIEYSLKGQYKVFLNTVHNNTREAILNFIEKPKKGIVGKGTS